PNFRHSYEAGGGKRRVRDARDMEADCGENLPLWWTGLSFATLPEIVFRWRIYGRAFTAETLSTIERTAARPPEGRGLSHAVRYPYGSLADQPGRGASRVVPKGTHSNGIRLSLIAATHGAACLLRKRSQDRQGRDCLRQTIRDRETIASNCTADRFLNY